MRLNNSGKRASFAAAYKVVVMSRHPVEPAKPETDPRGRASHEGEGLLAIENASFAYETESPVVRDFTAALESAQLTALLGPNAAGKSTLLKGMLGQLTPTRGTIRLAGTPITALSPRERARSISYVPQTGSVSFGFTVREVVAMGRYAAGRRLDDDAVDRAIEACDLQTEADRAFSHLSGGQQQRVILARAMAQSQGGGRVMLADEPGSHMDLWHVHHTMELFRKLARDDGLAVLTVVHDLNLAARYADHVWLMHRGQLVADGPWHEVLTPDNLSPIYGVTLTNMARAGDRPVFRVEPGDTL
jgi:iron complex transport system ATP-binding protein